MKREASEALGQAKFTIILLYLVLVSICVPQIHAQTDNIHRNIIFPNQQFSVNSIQLRGSTQSSRKTDNAHGNIIDYSSFFGSGKKNDDSKLAFLNFFSNYQAPEQDPHLLLKDCRRQYNGSHNNQQHPQWGSIYEPLVRKAPARYLDNISQPYSYLYTPRQISNMLGVMEPNSMIHEQSGKISMAFTFWGQFIDHDISLTIQSQEQKIKIPIPWCDQYLDYSCTGNSYINFKRSKYIQGSIPRLYENQITSWIDGGAVYGSNEQTSNILRAFSQGKLKTSNENLLPKTIQKGFTIFQSGDIRANQNIFLTSLHTTFMRQHNRLCDKFSQQHPQLSDEQLYWMSRNYVTGLIQKITFEQFLPTLLGRNNYNRIIGSYQGYNDKINPEVSIEFSTAGFRIGHSLLVDKYYMINEDKTVASQFALSQAFFKPDMISDQNLTKIIRGLRYVAAKKKDARVIDSIRNMLIAAPGSQIKIDLYSLNIQRAKDHGLSPYNTLRKYYGLKPIKNFSEIVKDRAIRLKLQFIYSNPDECDPWVGIIAEDGYDGGVLGELGVEIVGEQFKRIRNGDRYWYENALPSSLIKEIKDTSLEDILVRNIGIQKINKSMFQVIG